MAPTTPSQKGVQELAPLDNGSAIGSRTSVESVPNAHDTGTPQLYEGTLNSNAQHLSPAPSANR